LELISVPEVDPAEGPPALTGALLLTNDPVPEEPEESEDPELSASTGALLLTSDPLPELSADEPVPDPSLTGALVLINDP
jgi:hypothetical protein